MDIAPDNQDASVISPEPETILVVEDDDILRNLIREVLSPRYLVHAVAGVNDALSAIRDISYDLILVDIVLGKDSGIDLVEHARAHDPAIPVILMTAYANFAMAMRAINLGVSAFLQKPFHIEAVEAEVDKAITERRVARCRKLFGDYLERSNGIYRQAIADAVVEQRRLFISTFNTLAQTIDARDHYTGHHSQNVSRLSRSLAHASGLDGSTVSDTETAGLLHDIGKIAIPESVLCKPSALTENEYVLMKEHPGRAVEILSAMPEMEDIIIAIHTHHERFDGRGYPKGIAGRDIPVSGRILAICDAWDAMTTDRPYRKAMPIVRARAIMAENSGTQFDPDLLHVFLTQVRFTA